MKSENHKRLYEMALAGAALLASTYLNDENKKLLVSPEIPEAVKSLLEFVADTPYLDEWVDITAKLFESK